MRAISGTDATGCHPPSSTIRRTGRPDAPSIPVSSSTLPGRLPQPSWRMWARMSRKVQPRPLRVGFVDDLHVATAVALNAQEPCRERGERLSAVAAPVAHGHRAGGHRNTAAVADDLYSAAISVRQARTPCSRGEGRRPHSLTLCGGRASHPERAADVCVRRSLRKPIPIWAVQHAGGGHVNRHRDVVAIREGSTRRHTA